MRRRRWLRIPPLAIAGALLLAAPAAARVRVTGIDTGAYPAVRVTVVAPLGSRAPRVRENGRPVVGAQTTNLGAAKSIVLAVDRSRSMAGAALANASAGARAFVADKSGSDRVLVVSFGHAALALTQFSPAANESEGALRGMVADRTKGTALWDAVALAANRVRRENQAGRVIIVLTDGEDVSSAATFSDAVRAAHAARAAVYPIGIAGPNFTPGPLRDLARQTGGTYHQASSSAALATIYRTISRELARSWQVTYPTVSRPGERLRVEATVPGAGRAERTLTLPSSGAVASMPQPSPLLPRAFLRSAFAPFVLAGVVGLLILLACAFWAASREGLWVRSRLEPHLGVVRREQKNKRKRGRRAVLGRVSTLTEQAFRNVKQFRALQRMLEKADMPLRAPELLYICLGTSVLFGLFSAIAIPSPMVDLIFLALGFLAPIGFVNFKANSRVKAFDNQLPDLLITMAASLKAGHSFRQGVQSVVEEGAEPAAKEFKRVLNETRLGRPMDDALNDMSARVGSKNLQFMMTAVTIQRQIGGSMAGLFDMVAETVRQRQQFARKIRGLTSMGRASAWVLIGLPFFIALAVTVMNPGYMAPLYHSSTGHELIVIGLLMMGFGTLVLKKIVSFRG